MRAVCVLILGVIRRLPALALCLLGAACVGPGASPPPLPPAPYPLALRGPDRHAADPNDARLALRLRLVERINRDRAEHGVRPVAYDPLASRIGDAFCLDAVLTGVSAHFDAAGRAPYVRWGRGGGVDYHVQNVTAYAISSGVLDRPLEEIALAGHASMMAEQPPDDGHRRTILDRELDHVGIGLGVAAGEVRMTQEFSRVAFDWLALPDRPLPARSLALVGGKPLPGLSVALVEIRHEPPPRPLARDDPRRSGSYGYPPLVKQLWPTPPRGMLFLDGERPDFELRPDGSFFVQFPLDAGPGSYVAIVYVRGGSGPAGEVRPATALLVEALS
jgi:uncharacterized protein YkwD